LDALVRAGEESYWATDDAIWSDCTDDGGNPFFYNNLTGESVWERPQLSATQASGLSLSEGGGYDGGGSSTDAGGHPGGKPAGYTAAERESAAAQRSGRLPMRPDEIDDDGRRRGSRLLDRVRSAAGGALATAKCE
jgi:hypothetical protein